jgi:hypothetical protein
MHTFNTLAVMLSSVFFLFTVCTSALYLPQSHLPATQSDLANKCSFNVYHKQLCPSKTASKQNYIQINTLIDHANHITLDIAALRPVAARNSYNRISATQVFAIEGLPGNTNLTVRGEDGSDKVLFEHDGLSWSSDAGSEASCVSGAWNVEDWQCGAGSRVSWIKNDLMNGADNS